MKGVYVLYNDHTSSFEQLLDRDKGVTIHIKNMETLAIEMFKVSKNLSPPLVSEIFEKRNNIYDLRNPSESVRPRIRSVFNGKESISYLGPKIWDIVSPELKVLENVNAFKREIKKWTPECPCRLCKSFIQNVAFLNSVLNQTPIICVFFLFLYLIQISFNFLLYCNF